jgi:hypothetical protein
MAQSKSASLVEQFCNVGSGVIVALLTWKYIIEPVFCITKTAEESILITLIFTIISFMRGLLWRRGFNWWENRKEK